MSVVQTLPLSESNRREVKQFLKFAIVGTAGMVSHMAVFNILRLFLPSWLANAVGFTIAVVQNFSLNRFWTFPGSRKRAVGAQLGQFAIVSVIGLGINLIVFTVVSHLAAPIWSAIIADPRLAHTISDNFALATAILVVLFWNFTANRLWTFRNA